MNHDEDAEQAALFGWAAFHPRLKWMHAIPNGAHLAGSQKQRAAQMSRLKNQGLKTGVLDVFLPVASQGFHGLYIEMKRRKKSGQSRISKDQREFADAMMAEGYAVAICYGADEAIQAIKEYVLLLP